MADITTNTLKIGDNNLVLRDADAQAKIATNTQDISSLKEDLDVFSTDYVVPVFKATTITAEIYSEIDCNIPSGGYTVRIGNINTTDTDDTLSRIIFYSGSESIYDGLFPRNTPINISRYFSSDITKITVYAATNYAKSVGDTFTISNFLISQDSLKAFKTLTESVDEKFTIDVNLNDGYYAGWDAINSATDLKEKYTDKIPVHDGTIMNVSITHAENHDMWLAVSEWSEAGTYTRRILYSTNSYKCDINYIPTQGTILTAFSFRGYADFNLVITDLTTVKTDKINDNDSSYPFGEHVIKGINHRGDNVTAPENTMPAFINSVRNGFVFVETDVRFTSDNVPVLLHDATVDRTSNGTGAISGMTYTQARALDFGSWKSAEYADTKIPSFEEFIVFCRNAGVYPYVEISLGEININRITILLNIVKKYNMQKSVTWISYYYNNLANIVKIEPGARVGLIPSTALTDAIAQSVVLLRTGKNAVFVNINTDNASTAIALCQDYGIPLEVWVVDTEQEMLDMNDYISGVTSDNLNFETVKRTQALT